MAEENRAPEMRARAHAQAQAQAQALEGRSLFQASDDDILSREIEKLHKLDGQRTVEPVGFLIETMEKVIPSITRTLQCYFTGDEEQGQLRQYINRIAEGLSQCTEELAAVIHKIHSEITSGLARGIDNHSITMEVLNIVSRFPWGVKAVLPMVAFTVIYRDSCILLQMHDTTPLAKSVALIRGLPGAQVNIRPIYKLRFESVSNLINEMLQTTQCIRLIEALPRQYFPDEDPDLKDARKLFPNAIYAIIRSVVAAAAQISTSTPKRVEYVSVMDKWEIDNLVSRLKTMSDLLTAKHKLIDEKLEEELCRRIRIVVYEKVHMDNIAVLKVLISEDDSVPALYDCQRKRRVHLDKLSRRNVLLLISGLDITHEELYILEQAYTESRTHACEIVWIPVVDQSTQWTDAMRLQFETLRASMPCYTVHDPKIIRKAVIKFFRQDWHFYGKPILVVLDPQGRVVSPNAIHMMWIWQSEAFPFTSASEEELWQKQFWNLELLVDAIDQRILEWIREGKYIILYGGDNLKWIRDFTTRAKNIARDLRVPVEMVYVGKSHHKDMFQKLCSAIAVEQLSHCWQDPIQVWYFWTRLERMFHSKLKVGRMSDHSDIILQELQRLQGFNRGHEGWAILAKGSNIFVSAHGRLALTVLEDYEKWKERAEKLGLELAFTAYYQELYNVEGICTEIESPLTTAVPDQNHSLCPECHRPMQELELTFKCCHDNH